MATKRRWRRLLAVLLTLALMCSLSVQAFAASLPADAGTAEEETVSADMKAAAAALMEQRKAAGLVKADGGDQGDSGRAGCRHDGVERTHAAGRNAGSA